MRPRGGNVVEEAAMCPSYGIHDARRKWQKSDQFLGDLLPHLYILQGGADRDIAASS